MAVIDKIVKKSNSGLQLVQVRLAYLNYDSSRIVQS